jgi:hypothetical protein
MESDEPMCEAFARLVISTEWRRMRRASSEAGIVVVMESS